MNVDVAALLADNPILLIFFVIGAGYALGEIKVRGVAAGHITGVLLVSLACGAAGFQGYPEAMTLGFTLFIFCVGLQAGPSFLSVFLQDGSRYFFLAVFVVGVALGTAYFGGKLLGLDIGMDAGMLAGAMTSTPTLVGAQDAIYQGTALPEGVEPEAVLQNISVAYSVTYLMGLLGLISFVHLAPRVLHFNLPAEAAKIAPRGGRRTRTSVGAHNLPIIRAYIMGPQSEKRTIGDIQEETKQTFTVLAMRRGGKALDPAIDTVVREGDTLSVIAAVDQHAMARKRGVKEVFDKELLNFRIRSADIVVTSPEAVDTPLSELRLPARWACYPVGVIRAGIELPVNDKTILEKGDVLHVMGEEGRIHDLGEAFGTLEADVQDTDLLTLALGIAGGLLLGTLVVQFGGVSIALGSAGGLLLVGLGIGFGRSIYPAFGRFPPAARNLLMEFGIVLFMASVGLQAGAGVLGALASNGLALIATGALTTTVTFVTAYAFGRLALGLNPALLLGAIAGAMTSTPALQALTDAARSHVPALGYAGTYTFANVFLTFCGMLLITLA